MYNLEKVDREASIENITNYNNTQIGIYINLKGVSQLDLNIIERELSKIDPELVINTSSQIANYISNTTRDITNLLIITNQLEYTFKLYSSIEEEYKNINELYSKVDLQDVGVDIVTISDTSSNKKIIEKCREYILALNDDYGKRKVSVYPNAPCPAKPINVD